MHSMNTRMKNEDRENFTRPSPNILNEDYEARSCDRVVRYQWVQTLERKGRRAAETRSREVLPTS